ncbi:MAG: histidine-containing protein P-Ser-HPr phosphatase [Candidatus Saccharibacteria bacterium]|nr:histidine-containing protein P-Ser-HPr phosphatase [Candidatus Saccharibacteria bacterium]
MKNTAELNAKAIIFDADGTLFNSFELIVSAYRHVAETHNLKPPTPEEIRVQLGNSLPDIFRTFYPDQNIAELLAANNAFVAANTMKSEAFEGLHDMLSSLNNLGLKLAILTSGGANIHHSLKHHKVSDYFTSVVHHERIAKPKPDPEGFLLASTECGVKPGEAIMVGDTVSDILTGKNAGALATVAITHGYGLSNDLVDANPDYIVDSLQKFTDIMTNLSIPA